METLSHQSEADSPPAAAIEPAAPPSDRDVIDRDLAEALHGEVDRLPEAFRSPVVLCYFEGLTLDEAARRLRCPAGTLRSRLARARDRLRVALVRRGIVLSTATLAAVLETRAAGASVSPRLCAATARSALRFVSREAAASTAVTLACEVLRTMWIGSLAASARMTLLVAALLLAAGAGYRALARAIGEEATPEQRLGACAIDGRRAHVDDLLCLRTDEVSGLPLRVAQEPREPVIFAQRQRLERRVATPRDQWGCQQQGRHGIRGKRLVHSG